MRLRKAVRDQPLATLSLIVAVVALLLSAGSLITARQVYNHTMEQYLEDRLLVLGASFGDHNQELKVAPLDTGFHFSEGRAQFPSAIEKSVQPIDEGGRAWGMASIWNEITTLVSKHYPAKPGYSTFVNIEIPLIIYSRYSAKGLPLEDQSLYELRYSGVIAEGKAEPTGAAFTGLRFVTHLDPVKSLTPKDLEDIFEQGLPGGKTGN